MVFDKGVLDQRNLRFTLEPEEKLQFAKSFTEHLADAVFLVAPDARFLYANDAASCLAGYSREELHSMSMYDVDPDFSAKVWSEYWRTIKQQGSLCFETLYQTKEGRSLLLELSLSYLEYQGWECCCIFVRNITKRKQLEVALEKTNKELECRLQERTTELRDANEQLYCETASRKQTEAELEKSLSLLHATIESTALGIFAVSFEGDIVTNQNFVNMWQFPNSIITSQDFDQRLDFFKNQLKNPETFSRCIWEVYSQPNVEGYDILELKDGRLFECYSKPQQLGEKIIGRVWHFRDITESKRTEEALRQSEARFRTLAETTDAIIFINQGTQFCYVNPTAEAITGYKREELLAYPDIRKLIQERVQVYRAGKLVFPQYEEIKILTKNREERWLDCRVGVIEIEGKLTVLGTAIDVTKRKQAEVDIRQALEKEKDKSEFQAAFVSIVSHEFRTFLNNISLSTSSLRRYSHQWTEEERLQYLNDIEIDVEQLSLLLDEVLIIGMAEVGKLKFEPSPLDLAQFCRDILTEMQLGKSSQHVFSVVSRGDFSAACMDKKLLQPILRNLLSNAIKYSPPNSKVDLELSCQNENVIFQIKDQGIGIPAADQQQLFELFYRGRNVGTIQGTGLGLAVVKKFVDLHDGQISVASEVGVGTTFTVTLPLNSR